MIDISVARDRRISLIPAWNERANLELVLPELGEVKGKLRSPPM
jgi:hypothetical protein